MRKLSRDKGNVEREVPTLIIVRHEADLETHLTLKV
jgi:hypothetical protein